jgi:ADP-heptose:LPS heptosyltransferase
MPNTQMAANQDVRKVIAILPFVDMVVACDSFIHHASASLGTPVPTMVLWGGTSEKNLGYESQINVRTHNVEMVEPNRVPHDRSLYVNANRMCNEFSIEEVAKQMPKVEAVPVPECGGCK